jgi:hypothetical protein
MPTMAKRTDVKGLGFERTEDQEKIVALELYAVEDCFILDSTIHSSFADAWRESPSK